MSLLFYSSFFSVLPFLPSLYFFFSFSSSLLSFSTSLFFVSSFSSHFCLLFLSSSKSSLLTSLSFSYRLPIPPFSYSSSSHFPNLFIRLYIFFYFFCLFVRMELVILILSFSSILLPPLLFFSSLFPTFLQSSLSSL